MKGPSNMNINIFTKLVIVFMTLLTNICLQNVNAQQDLDKVNHIYFVNGINNTLAEANINQLALAYAYLTEDDIRIRYPDEDFKFLLAYNESRGFIKDIIVTINQKVEETGGLTASQLLFLIKLSKKAALRQIKSLAASSGGGIIVSVAVQAVDMASDIYIEKLKEDAQGKSLEVEQETLDKHIQLYNSSLCEGKRVIIVAHSQGNLFANKAVENIINNKPYFEESIGILGVANPAGRIMGDNVYITAHDDFVIDILRVTHNVLESNIDNDPGFFIFGDPRDGLHHNFMYSYLASKFFEDYSDKTLPSRQKIDEYFYHFISTLSFPKPVCDIIPTLNGTPDKVIIGDPLNITGEQFTPNERAFFEVYTPDGFKDYMFNCDIDENGNIVTMFQTNENMQPGQWTYWAFDNYTSIKSQTASFEIIPQINPQVTVSPTQVYIGNEINESGTGFTANSIAILHFINPQGNEEQTIELITDANGNFEHSYTVTDITLPGVWQYYAVDEMTGIASPTVEFTINQYNPTISLDRNEWDAYILGYGNIDPAPDHSIYETNEGLKAHATYSRSAHAIYKKGSYNFIDKTMYLKWRAGDDNNRFIQVVMGIGWMGASYVDGINQIFTYPNAYRDFKKFDYNTWYYTQVSVTSDKRYVCITSLNNYADEGGTEFDFKEGDVSDWLWLELESAENSTFFFRSGDCHGGSSAWFELGEVKLTNNASISVSPNRGNEGDVLQELGTGFTPYSAVVLHYINPSGNEEPTIELITDENGNFEHTFPVTQTTQSGTWQFYAVDGVTGTQTSNVTFIVNPANSYLKEFDLDIGNTFTIPSGDRLYKVQDIDNNGFLNFITHNPENLWINIFEMSNQQLQLLSGTPIASGDVIKYVIDMDNDGAMDFVISNTNSRIIKIYEWENQSLALRRTINHPGTLRRSPVVAEVDGDNTPEMILTTWNDGWIYESTGDNLYAVKQQIHNLNIVEQIKTGDTDTDGRKEFIIGSEGNPTRILIFEAIADDSYQLETTLTGNRGNCNFKGVLDVNGNGITDIVFGDDNFDGNNVRRIYIYENRLLKYQNLDFDISFGLGDTDHDGIVDVHGFTKPSLGDRRLLFWDPSSNLESLQLEYTHNPTDFSYSIMDITGDAFPEIIEFANDHNGIRNMFKVYHRSANSLVQLYDSDNQFTGFEGPLGVFLLADTDDPNFQSNLFIQQGTSIHCIRRIE